MIAIAREALAGCCALTIVLAGARARAGEGLDPRIVNGVLAWEPPSVGAWLCGAIPCLPEDGEPVPDPHLIVDCSGTLIGCRTFVTAGHCVCHLLNATSCHETIPRDPSTHRVFLQHAGVFAVESIRVHPDYNYVTGNADVAVVKLAEPVPGVSPAVLNDLGTPPFGTPGTIVGFGQGESGPVGPTRGIKRSGSVITADCQPGISNEGHICWNYEEPLGPPGSDSNTCFGDSGGALFAHLGGGAVLAGVTHGGNSGFCGPPEVGDDQDVYWQRDFIVGEAGADLGTTCGDVAPVGHPRTVTSEFSGTLSGGKVEDLHAFDVAAGMALLRVTLNAQPKGGASDFDLYLKAGAPPTPSDFDCAAADPSQFGSCEIPSPAPGTWHMLVERVAGDGDYQVTVVAAPEPSQALLFAAGALVLAAATLLRKFHFDRLDESTTKGRVLSRPLRWRDREVEKGARANPTSRCSSYETCGCLLHTLLHAADAGATHARGRVERSREKSKGYEARPRPPMTPRRSTTRCAFTSRGSLVRIHASEMLETKEIALPAGLLGRFHDYRFDDLAIRVLGDRNALGVDSGRRTPAQRHDQSREQ